MIRTRHSFDWSKFGVCFVLRALFCKGKQTVDSQEIGVMIYTPLIEIPNCYKPGFDDLHH
jgi:hypothetical protein